MPEIKCQDREGGFIKEGEMNERRVQRVLGTVEVGSGRVLKKSFV